VEWAVDPRHALEAVGVVVFGALFYSYTYQLFPVSGRGQRLRTAANGIFFGGVSVILMIARLELESGTYVDARGVPVALIALFEGWPAGMIAGVIAAVYRLWLGGAGALAGAGGLIAVGLAGGLVHAWARREGGVAPRHAFALAALVYAITFLSFTFVPDGLARFGKVWLPLFLVYAVGIGIIARVFHDVLEQARLREAQQRFRAIIDEATDAIRIVDADTYRILETNRMDCEVSGYSREEMIGRDVRDFWPIDAELRAQRQAAVTDTFKSGFTRQFGLTHRLRSGETILIDATRRLVEHQGREYFLTIYRDAKERLDAEATRREASELRAMTLLAGAVAHEINNPLAVVVGHLGLLARRFPDGQESKWIQNGMQASQRVREIVARMARITRVEIAPPQSGLPPILDFKKSSDAD
jgi:PAS domain S-box-containing protein